MKSDDLDMLTRARGWRRLRRDAERKAYIRDLEREVGL